MIKVSIIITCYNYGRFVRDAIDGALNQSYDNVEVVVVNDGSTDDSHDVISTYKDRIVYINQKNQGAARARNTGILNSTGNFILCLDADDWVSETYVEDAINLIEDDYSIISPVAVFTDSELNATSEIWPSRYIIDTNGNTLNDIIFVNRANSCSLFSKKLWELSEKYDDIAPRGEDWLFWMSLLKLGCKIKYIAMSNTPHYKYRKHGISRIANCSDESVLLYAFKKHFNVNNRKSFIHKLYEVILLRSPDKGGLESYLKSDLSILQIRDILFNSDEYKRLKRI
jgi:glycosyltransferase involved in cell wall biosynthesis